VRSCSESSRARSAARRRPRVRLSLATPSRISGITRGGPAMPGGPATPSPEPPTTTGGIGPCCCLEPCPLRSAFALIAQRQSQLQQLSPPWRRELRLQRATPPSGLNRSTINWVGPTSRTTPANPSLTYVNTVVSRTSATHRTLSLSLQITGGRARNRRGADLQAVRSHLVALDRLRHADRRPHRRRRTRSADRRGDVGLIDARVDSTRVAGGIRQAILADAT